MAIPPRTRRRSRQRYEAMSKKAHPRRLTDTEAKASVRTIQTTPRKVNLLAGLIRGKSAQAAKAEIDHQLDVDKLYIAEASVGRAFALKRFHARARGRGARVEKMWSNLTIVVREREENA